MHQLMMHRRTLMLQGPMGSFFARLASFLEQEGQTVTKVNFNGGDAWFHRGRGALAFRGTAQQWPAWLRDVLQSRRIEAIVLFGQMRPLHVDALHVAKEHGVEVFVFEEGYLRPDFVTLERGGVNAYSSLPPDEAAYRSLPEPTTVQPQATGQRFRKMAGIAMQYSLATWLGRAWFRHHAYHRSIHPLRESALWLRGGWRKLLHGLGQRGVLQQLCIPGRANRWYLLPLQVANDSQIIHHSRFEGMHQVIQEVVASFAEYAPPDNWLVIKHHPMDRPYSDYTKHIDELVDRHHLQGRVLYVHDLHLPTLLKHCRGVVTVNSTTGLQALHHGVPVCTLADCFYTVPRLVDAGPLERFWQSPSPVDRQLYRRFHHYAVRATQLNVSFYANAPALDAAPTVQGHTWSEQGASPV